MLNINPLNTYPSQQTIILLYVLITTSPDGSEWTLRGDLDGLCEDGLELGLESSDASGKGGNCWVASVARELSLKDSINVAISQIEGWMVPGITFIYVFCDKNKQ